MNSTNTEGKTYSPVGAMFMTVGTNTWKLGEIKPKDGCLNPNTEFLQEFHPTTGAIGTKYCYIDATQAKAVPFLMWKNNFSVDPVGWWVKPASGNFGPNPSLYTRADDVEIKSGAGYLSNFIAAKAKLNFPSSIPSAK